MRTSINNSVKPSEKKKDDYNALNKKRQCPQSRIHSTMDWRYTNTQLVYKENLKDDCETNTPSQLLIKHQYASSMNLKTDPEKLFTNINLKSEQDNKNNHSDKVSEITQILQQKFAYCGNNSKLKKAIDGVSKFYEDNFYRNFKVEKMDRTCEIYEIDKIRDSENFNLNQIKGMFNSAGIHVFDVKMNGKYVDGNHEGKLTFKIRKNEDMNSFEEKRRNLFRQITDEMGFDLKKINPNNKKILTSILPTTIKYNNPKVEKIIKNNKNFPQNQMKPKNIPANEKLGKIFPKEINVYYKNASFGERHIQRPKSQTKK